MASEHRPEKRPLTLLLVDDDPQLLRALCRWMKRMGHDVTACSSAVAAIEQVEQQRFDAILSDIVMPDCDGVELLSRLRRHGDLTPIVLMSGGAEMQRTIEGIAQDAVCFITKPVAPDLIEDVLTRLATPPETRDSASSMEAIA